MARLALSTPTPRARPDGRLGIPASQLAHFLLLQAWQWLEQGEIDPEPFLLPSTSPAFRNNLDVEAVVEANKRHGGRNG